MAGYGIVDTVVGVICDSVDIDPFTGKATIINPSSAVSVGIVSWPESSPNDFNFDNVASPLSSLIPNSKTIVFGTAANVDISNPTDIAWVSTRVNSEYPNDISNYGAKDASDNVARFSNVQIAFPFTLVRSAGGYTLLLMRRPEWSPTTFDEYSWANLGGVNNVPAARTLYPLVGDIPLPKKITNFYLADFSGEAPVERPQPIELERLQSTELRFCAVYEDGEFEEWTGGVEYSAYVGDGAFSFEGRELTILEDARSPQIIASFRPVYDNVSEGAFASVNIKVTNPLGPNDPYSPGGFGQQTNPTGPGSPTIPGGSTGTPSGPSSGKWDDAIGGTSVPGHSPISSTSTGLFRTYSMNISDIQALGQKLWSANVLDVLSKYFENPADLIMGILEFPFSLPSGTREEIKFNWLPTDISTLDVQGGLLAQEYQVLDFGTINIPRISGMFYDYQPYTTAEIFLPYIGFVPIKYSEIVDSTLHLEYCVSLVTGSACAVLVSGKAGVIGTYNAIIGRNLPITARDFSSVYTSLAKAGLAATAGIVGAGVGAAAGMAANSFSSDVSNFYRPGAVSTIGRIETAANIGTQMTGHFTRNFGQSAINSVSNANGNITRSGYFDAAVGRCSNQNAFVLVSAPHQNLPAAYGHTIGYPTNIGGYLGQFSGYTEIRSINIVAEGATATELVEIENLLKGGIII